MMMMIIIPKFHAHDKIKKRNKKAKKLKLHSTVNLR